MNIYLISLSSDTKRREILEKKFPKYYKNFILIDAVDGRQLSAKEFFQQTTQFVLEHRRMMSPSELGCSLSHIKAMKDFLATNDNSALIIEDDIIGDDMDIDRIIQIATDIKDSSLVICGGQEGLNNEALLYGKKTTIKNLFELSTFSHNYIMRTSSYLITRGSAQAILDYQAKHLGLADNWDKFFINTSVKIYFSKILAHPIDLGNSHIETDRKIFREKQKSILQKLLSKKVFFYIFRKLNILLVKLQGYKRIEILELDK